MKNQNIYPDGRYAWKGLKPKISKWFFRWKPMFIKGANFREIWFLWWKFSVRWPYHSHAIWQDGWDACFRECVLNNPQIPDSAKYPNRVN